MKTKHYTWMYWMAQAFGWGALYVFNIFVLYTTRPEQLNRQTMLLITLAALMGLFYSHLFRTFILRWQVVDKSLKSQLLVLTGLLVGGSILQSVSEVFLTMWVSGTPFEKDLTISMTIVNLINWHIIYLVWMILYMFYQVVQKQRSKIIQELKLTALQNEIELTNLKAQLNPHFMFNSMNSIRALIDENPQKAKTAVTKLSGLLRHSLQYNKRNFVHFSDEVELVNDYLFLEKMRFEERLEFSFNIAPATLNINFPPFMLQTIVENAIKHGISSLPEGGRVDIVTRNKGRFHEIEVINSGRIIPQAPDMGIGLSNTLKRLRILYGDEASFDLNEENDSVHCKMIIPA